MSLIIREELCAFDENSGSVVIDSDQEDGSLAYTELRSADCRRKALMHAAKNGLASAGVSDNVATYPVDSDGKEVIDPRQQKIAAFRAEVRVARRIF
jgi:aminopeptidase-like protein